jgi:hypothetical protein
MVEFTTQGVEQVAWQFSCDESALRQAPAVGLGINNKGRETADTDRLQHQDVCSYHLQNVRALLA